MGFVYLQSFVEVMCVAHKRCPIVHDVEPCEGVFPATVLFMPMPDIHPAGFVPVLWEVRHDANVKSPPCPPNWGYLFSAKGGFSFFCPEHIELRNELELSLAGPRAEGA